MSNRSWLLCAILSASALLSGACGDKQRPAGAPADPGKGGTTPLAHGGEPGAEGGADTGQGGSDARGDAGGPDTAEGGAGGSGGSAGSAGSAGNQGLGGGTPPVGDPPVCAHESSFGEGTRLPLSAAGDDLLQAITPDELTIAWKTDSGFFVADRLTPEDDFGEPLPVTGSASFVAVALGSAGSLLVAVRQDLTVVELHRSGQGAAFDEQDPTAGAFEQLNTTISSIPLGNQVLGDPLLSNDGSAFIFSHYSAAAEGSHISVQESLKAEGQWTYGSAELGSILYAQDEKRRIPTGVSSDLLTLFYKDEVEGDFRAAWRINRQVPFDYAETLALGQGTEAAAPNTLCDRIYYSAQGDDGLDLFVAERQE